MVFRKYRQYQRSEVNVGVDEDFDKDEDKNLDED
jgi:hypothetical protein